MNYTCLRNWLFYTLKPFIPRPVQIFLRRQLAQHMRRKNGCLWPIDPHAAKPPEGWPGWPDGKKFALVLSHDVDTAKGYQDVLKLADIEEALGFRSSFNFVPERYGVISLDLLGELKQRGFGIGVHGLKHDGKLFSSKKIFDKRASQINAYLKKWGTQGFTAPSMIRNHDWMQALDIDYCISTFDTDPFEPQPDGVGTIFPFAVFRKAAGSASRLPGGSCPSPCAVRREPSVNPTNPTNFFTELPYTLVQDCTLFVVLGEKTIDHWKQKLDWIASNGGMALLNTHPDYMNFSEKKCGSEEYPSRFYPEFLEYVRTRYQGRYWPALPSQVYEFWINCLACHAQGAKAPGAAARAYPLSAEAFNGKQISA
jgi:hypothetical protein